MRGGARLAAAFVLPFALFVPLSGCLVTEGELQQAASAAGLDASFPAEAERVVLPELLDEDTCIVRDGDVHLVGAAAARPSASGASLVVLVRGGSLLVDAAIAAGPGEPGPHVAGTRDVTARGGDDGGSVVLLAPDGVVELRLGGVQTGNGGHGGGARSDEGNATAGDGGDGGWFVAGGRALTRGAFTVELGAGAPGGEATVTRAGPSSVSLAGAGGAAGREAIADPAQALALAEALASDCADVEAALERILGVPDSAPA